MELKELSTALNEHNEKGGTYQVHLNTTSLEDSTHIIGVEFADIYFTDCKAIKTVVGEQYLLSFGNSNRKPILHKEDGTLIYPTEIGSNMTIDMSKVETIEEVADTRDWFDFPSLKIINLYMFPESKDMDGNRNVVSIGFME